MTTTIISDENDVNKPLAPGSSEVEGDSPPVESQTTTADDEALPEVNGRDAICLLASSPGRLFLHWSHAGDPFETLKKAFGEAAARYRVAIRAFDLNNGEERIHAATPERQQWLDALPGRDYRVEVGFHAGSLPFISILSSAVVQTPRNAFSPHADNEPQFHVTAEVFSRVQEATGYEACVTQEPKDHEFHNPLGSSQP